MPLRVIWGGLPLCKTCPEWAKSRDVDQEWGSFTAEPLAARWKQLPWPTMLIMLRHAENQAVSPGKLLPRGSFRNYLSEDYANTVQEVDSRPDATRGIFAPISRKKEHILIPVFRTHLDPASHTDAKMRKTACVPNEYTELSDPEEKLGKFIVICSFVVTLVWSFSKQKQLRAVH